MPSTPSSNAITLSQTAQNTGTGSASTLPSYRNIYDQDYPPQYQGLVSQLSVPLNYGFQALYSLVNNGLTFKSNLACTIQTFPVSVDANGVPTTSVSVTKTVTGTVVGVLVVKVTNPTTPTQFPTGAVFVSYSETATSLNILSITGLPASTTWNITIVAIQ